MSAAREASTAAAAAATATATAASATVASVASGSASSAQRPGSSFVAGSLSGCLVTLVLQPLDVLKTRVQASSGAPGYRALVRTIVRSDGAAGLWVGWSPALMRVAIGQGVYFSCLETLLPRLRGPDGSLSKTDKFVAAGLARCAAGLVTNPIAVVKSRLENGASNTSVTSAVTRIVREEGVRGLGRGYLPSVLRDAPYSGLYLVLYTGLRDDLSAAYRARMSSVSSVQRDLQVSFIAGYLAGAGAVLVTHPFDVARTHLQLERGRSFSGMVSNLVGVVRAGGVAALYRGFLPRFVRKPLGSAITWAVFDRLFPGLFSGGLRD